MDYKQAGVDIEEGYRAVGKYKEFAASTLNESVLNGIGSFAGMYSLKEFFDRGMEEPVLVSGTDGVGTKLDIALKMKKYDTIGIDCTAMCLNDILCHGARPLFFLDYIACGKLNAGIAAEIVKGVARGCRETGTVLLGGETAEHPGVMPDDLYDLAGFAAGIVDKKKIIDGKKIREGDVLLGIASSGVHSNGFSLIRKVIPNLDEDFGGMPIGLALLVPTRLYVRPILELMEIAEIHGMAHITGGAFYENIPRMFPKESSFSAVIRECSWKIPAVFSRIAAGCFDKNCSGSDAQKTGEKLLAEDEEMKRQMFKTFNMGIGFVIALNPSDAKTASSFLEQKGFPAWEIGRVENSKNSNRELYFVR